MFKERSTSLKGVPVGVELKPLSIETFRKLNYRTKAWGDQRPIHVSAAAKRLPRNSQLTNIVKTAVRIIAGSDTREVSRAAEVIGVSEPTLYRWQRAGSMREARGAEVLRVQELTGFPLEMLLRG